MGCVKIFKNNLIDSDIANAITASSENASFPASNTYAFERRTKVWHSDGYWEVTASNNTIVFQEVDTVDLTATIAVGNYTSDASFFAAVKTALEDVGAKTYTVARNATTGCFGMTQESYSFFKFRVTASTGFCGLVGFLTGTDLETNPHTATYLVLHSNEWIKLDCGLPTNPEAFIMCGKRNSAIELTNTSTIKLQGNETDAWTGPSYEASLTYDEQAIYLVSDSGLHTGPLRYWRIYFEDRDNANLYIEVSNLFLGFMLEQTRGAVQFPLASVLVDTATTVYSDGGQSYSSTREKSESFTLEWLGLTVSEKEDIEDFYKQVGVSNPFFILLDANAVFSSSSNRSLRYVKFSDQPRISLLSPGHYRIEANVREEL